MNYRHAFHAGNHADILKHVTLTLCLERLRAKEAAFFVLDTHAGRGVYDLHGDAAQRSPEWRTGLGRLIGWRNPPAELAGFMTEVEADARAGRYAGSPEWIHRRLRFRDRAAFCELHPEEAAALKRQYDKRLRREVHFRDGYQALGALLPPKERRGLVLIDPPYERGDEVEAAVAAIRAARRKFAHGIYLWWRPLKPGQGLERAEAELMAEGPAPWLRLDLAITAPLPGGRLAASSMFVLNPPYQLETDLAASLRPLMVRLGQGDGAGFILRAHRP